MSVRMNGFPVHIQSMLLATDLIGLDILLEKGLLRCYTDMGAAINAETHLSPTFEEAGYSLYVMMTAWHGDPVYKSENYEECTYQDPIHHTGSYYDHNIHPYEVIFAKANRDQSTVLDYLTDWHDGMEYSSYEKCRPKLHLTI